MKRLKKDVNANKVFWMAVITNSMQVGLMLLIALYAILRPETVVDQPITRYLLVLAACVVIWGGVMDIREAVSTRQILRQMDDMDDTISAMEGLNNTLRAQRHDFLNHLQVVYSLMEMGEYDEANAYIERVYGAITAVSRVMKTANPAINALLQVKLAVCEKEGIRTAVNIQSSWKDLPIPGWEMCKVLSNLIDNAVDALAEVTDRQLTITLTEDLRAFRFAVSNNGPMIPVKSQKDVFNPGVTTKATGHGMGLYIVKKTLCDRGGDVTLVSDGGWTEFSGYLPKELAPIQDK